jgi:hypothetical protein
MATMDPRSQDAIRRQLLQAMSNTVLREGAINFQEILDDLFLVSAEVRKSKKDWFRKWDVLSMYLEYVSKAVAPLTDDMSRMSCKLGDILSTTASEDLAGLMVSHVANIPYEYVVFFELPFIDYLGYERVDISSVIWLREIKKKSELPRGTHLSFFGALDNNEIMRTPKVFLCLSLTGYATNNLDSDVLLRAILIIKGLLYFGLTFDLVNYARYRQDSRSLNIDHHMTRRLTIAAQPTAANGAFEASAEVPQNLAVSVNSLRLVEDAEFVSARSEKRLLETHLRTSLGPIATVISGSVCDRDREPIIAASNWAYDSLVEEREIFGFLSTCMGLEAILGEDDDREEITSILANRCAFLVGGTRKVRGETVKKFREFYQLRSKVVHGRITKLGENAELLYWGQHTLRRIILLEWSSIYKSLKKSE